MLTLLLKSAYHCPTSSCSLSLCLSLSLSLKGTCPCIYTRGVKVVQGTNTKQFFSMTILITIHEKILRYITYLTNKNKKTKQNEKPSNILYS